ncbi:MAG: ubiquitin-like protein [Chlamydiales bacterium]
MQIFVQKSNISPFNTITLEVNPTDTVWRVKNLVREKLGINEENQILKYACKQLNDDYSIAYYNISKESTLRLEFRPRSKRCVGQWQVSDKFILAYRKGQELFSKLYDPATESSSGPYDITIENDQTVASVTASLALCEIIFRGNGTPPHFSPRLHKWKLGKNEVIFHTDEHKNLICQIFNTKSKTRIYRNIDLLNILQDCFPSARCHDETKVLIAEDAERVKMCYDVAIAEDNFTVAQDCLVKFLKKFEVSCIISSKLKKDRISEDIPGDVTLQEAGSHTKKSMLVDLVTTIAGSGIGFFCPPIGLAVALYGFQSLTANGVEYQHIHHVSTSQQSLSVHNLIKEEEYHARITAFVNKDVPFLIEIEPISEQSRIDSRVLVSEWRWGVTLVSYQGPFGEHAKIFAEGIQEGKYTRWIFEFSGPRSIQTGPDTDEELKFTERSPIWKVSIKNVLKLNKSFANKKERIAADIAYKIPFAYLGPSKEYPEANNCFTFAMKQLKKAGIVDLGDMPFFGGEDVSPLVTNYMKFSRHPCSSKPMYDLDNSTAAIKDRGSL